MSSPAQDYAGPSFESVELFPGERLSPDRPPNRKAKVWGSLVLVMIGGGWTLFGDSAALSGWWSTLTAALPTVTASRTPEAGSPLPETGNTSHQAANSEPALPPATLVPSSTPSPIPAPPEVVGSPEHAVILAMPPAQTIAPPPAVKATDEPSTPAGQAPGPHQKRAKAVGLHPDLSQVLLERLSAADYRNAGVAIKTALSETPDSAVFVWPRNHKPELALFKVRFVPGATAGCRRYVVTVTKDGWLTTALPVERCDVKLDGAKIDGNKAEGAKAGRSKAD